MPRDRLEALRLQEPIPPGATAVYRALGGGDVYHADPDCHHLPAKGRIFGYTLATALNWPIWSRRPCEYCTAEREQLTTVVRELDEYPGGVDVQGSLFDLADA